MSGYAAETDRLFLERLSLEKHLDDFHELWNNDQAVLWSYVLFNLLNLRPALTLKHSSKPAKKTLEESKDWMVNFILPTKETPDIDKFALLLKNEKNEKGKLKMVGFVGTNRWCEQGMDVGYCLNIAYWNHGYATEGMKAFLDIFWSLPGK
jgi:RimJ/RimL family protein N-acetyltransferase